MYFFFPPIWKPTFEYMSSSSYSDRFSRSVFSAAFGSRIFSNEQNVPFPLAAASQPNLL